ncbi:50S ribosomal protein L1 [Candidatus Dependentiae bacterium]|nr:50S ribosomal protein L1 [Candidatus Dependentiae bacterium]
MTPQTKRVKENLAKFEKDKAYSIEEAISLLKQMVAPKFNETVELHVRLGVDPRHADQIVRGTIILPHGTGKDVRVIVFAKGEEEEKARLAGANEVGSADLIEKIQGGWLDFDVAIAQPEMMRDVGKIARILGPRGLMPNPKSGTVAKDIEKAVKEFKSGKLEYRVDKTSIIHVPVGKVAFDEAQLLDNLKAIFYAIVRAKPASAKGQYIKSVFITSTMGPSIKVDGPGFINFVKQQG